MPNTFLQGAKYMWLLPHVDEQQSLDLASLYNLSLPIVQVLQYRGLTSREKIDSFLFSSYEKDVAHASLLQDAEKAVQRIIRAVEAQEKILIFGDYDVDGISSTALALECLLPLGAKVNFYLPHRVRDGYGLSKKIVGKAIDSGYSLIITVDNGITAHEAVELAQANDIDVVITDHHKPHDQLPNAYAIVNPQRQDCEYPFKYLAGVGVIFKVMSLLYEYKKMQLPERVYEFLLLGTIADVVPLLGENRFWVREGLRIVKENTSYSLQVLCSNVNLIKPSVSSSDIGFAVAPQLNALGRLEDPRKGVKFLLGTDKKETEHIGAVLYELNQARKDIEKSIFNEVVAEIEAGHINLKKEHCIIAASESWPPGVIGLVASRLVGAYGKPTILLHLSKDGIAKGSCRSIPEFDIFQALKSGEHLLTSFGGHANAAGLSLLLTSVPALKEHMEHCIREQLSEEDLKQKLVIHAALKLPDLNKRTLQDMAYLEPFGNANEMPVFVLHDVSLVQAPRILKDAHVKCQIFAEGIIKPVIFFNRPDLFDVLQNMGTESFSVAAQVHENYWNGKTNIELTGIDIAV
ncbi:single-stranded-DNA-specific exonuclease RecJ [Candidatus Babeliales bacterium]|nr:single-stranded-DNA-specific exonuclease RecJ [Candidatus Babeliales bacterium]